MIWSMSRPSCRMFGPEIQCYRYPAMVVVVCSVKLLRAHALTLSRDDWSIDPVHAVKWPPHWETTREVVSTIPIILLVHAMMFVVLSATPTDGRSLRSPAVLSSRVSVDISTEGWHIMPMASALFRKSAECRTVLGMKLVSRYWAFLRYISIRLDSRACECDSKPGSSRTYVSRSPHLLGSPLELSPIFTPCTIVLAAILMKNRVPQKSNEPHPVSTLENVQKEVECPSVMDVGKQEAVRHVPGYVARKQEKDTRRLVNQMDSTLNMHFMYCRCDIWGHPAILGVK